MHSRRASRAFILVAVLSGLLPFAGVSIAYVLSVDAGVVPGCFPYLEGCTSVSATGRHPPGSFVYRGTMLPVAVVIVVYWYLAAQWLAAHGDDSLRRRALPWMGLIAAFFLIIYTTVLGHVGDWYAIQRRIGVVGYLSATFFGQLLLASRISDLSRSGALQLPAWILRGKLALCGCMLLLGLALIPVPYYFDDVDKVERILEWNFSALLTMFFPLTGLAWYYDGFRADFSVTSR